MRIEKLTKTLRAIIVTILWTWIGIYVLLSLPPIRKGIANRAEVLLSELLKTEVKVGSVNIGLLNSITIDDVSVSDLNNREIMKISRIAATISLRDLLNEKITVEGAQLFGLSASLYKHTPQSTGNWEFIIKALKSEEKDEDKKINLRINTLIVRHANIKYDVESVEKINGMFSPHHIDIRDFALTANLKIEEKNNISISIKRLDGKEINSGLEITHLRSNIEAIEDIAQITNTEIGLCNSILRTDTINISYTDWGNGNKGNWLLDCEQIEGHLNLRDFSPLTNKLKKAESELDFFANISGSNKGITIKDFRLSSKSGSINLAMDGVATFAMDEERDMEVNVRNLDINDNGLTEICQIIGSDVQMTTYIEKLKYIDMNGFVYRGKDSRIIADGILNTGCGDMVFSGLLDENNWLECEMEVTNLCLSELTNDYKFGKTSFTLIADGTIDQENQPLGNISGLINNLEYSNYNYKDIKFDVTSQHEGIKGLIVAKDENIDLNVTGEISHNQPNPVYNIDMQINKFCPNRLNLTEKYEGESLSLKVNANIKGKSINDIAGKIHIDSITIQTPQKTYFTESIKIVGENIANGNRRITTDGDFIDATVTGKFNYSDIANSFINKLGASIPILFKTSSKLKNVFEFEITLKDSEMARHLLNTDLVFYEPVMIAGSIDDTNNFIETRIRGNNIFFNGDEYKDLYFNANNDENLKIDLGVTRQEKKGHSTKIGIEGKANNNRLDTKLSWTAIGGDQESKGTLNASAMFSDSLGRTKTLINLNKSNLVIKDTIWNVHPSSISIYGENIAINNVGISQGNKYVRANGIVSSNQSDSLTIELNELPVDYIQDVVNFHSVEFGGRASGRAYVTGIYNSTPTLDAYIKVRNMIFEEGRMGNANLHAFWDSEVEGISIKGVMIDEGDIYTGVDGYVSPKNNRIDLLVSTHNTRAEFLNGIIGSIFDDIYGHVNGDLRVTGPLNDINLVGDVAANVDMTLHPTNVRYRIKGDTIRLRPYNINFENITIYDNKDNKGLVNGNVGHKNLKNFRYDFNINLDNLTCYDEKTFNSDKFYATVFADGNMTLNGADGHPLRINATVSPTRGSVFAYDAATPDAISNASFLTFRNKEVDFSLDSEFHAEDDELKTSYSDYKYSGDIYMNININLNKNCEIKLRMDNTEDGYMSTYGQGTIQAIYHNKSPFQLHGTYAITEGKYRLFLQDIIYRDLLIQPGSQVDFSGDPFKAGIHLICWHTINSVPLSDLTATTAFSYNNKVKVICVLDITGTLANMNFKFDLNLPNVNDETRQLVRSMINSEEEMNTQIIYLLGLGRFYTNEYARANGEDNSSQAVNSLLSSTLSGQINQMLSNAIGANSNWNFGTGLSTGENGWEDIDVEGMLSGRLLNDRLLINGNFGYRDNTLTQTSNFIGDFDVKWKISETGNTYIKAYNQTNDRYFTKATLNTQGIGISYERDFETWRELFRLKRKKVKNDIHAEDSTEVVVKDTTKFIKETINN